jgi:signal transduction histidine kinase
LLAGGSRWVGALTTVTLIALALLGGPAGRWGGVLGLVALLVFTPAGERIGLRALFSPATFYLDVLGPFSSSAGALLLLAGLIAIAALHRAQIGVAPRTWRVVVALALAGAAPWIMLELASGISPPSTGTTLGGWVAWQATMMLTGGAIGLAASRMAAGRRESSVWTLPALLVTVLPLAVLGLIWWQPPGRWPVLFGVAWVIPIWLAVQPAPRVRQLASIGLVAGAAACLLTWGQTVQGRILLAERDVRRIEGGDPVAIGFLERFADDLLAGPPPGTAAELYALWRRSPLSQEDYPGVMVTWEPEGQRRATLQLSELDLQSADLEMLSETARDSLYPILRTLTRELGVHYAIAVPYANGAVATVAVAPRSQLIRPVLVGRFLRGERRLYAPYSIKLGESPADGEPRPDDGWSRDGWTLRGGWLVQLQGTRPQHLHVVVELKDLSQLLVRGALLVVLDVLLLLLLGFIGSGIAGRLRLPSGWPDGVRFHSYRNRLALALAAFFVIPTLGFATWSVGRVRTDAVRGRDLLIQQTLSDAVGTAGTFPAGSGTIPAQLDELAERLNTDLLWYEGGDLAYASAEVLAQLGLLDPYLPADVHLALSERDELEFTHDAVIGGQLTRVGYRAIGSAGDLVALAAPRLVELSDIQREQEDLLYGLFLVTVLGLGGALSLAAYASRTLARPVQSLESAAGAVGRGAPVPPFDDDIPTEFVSVVNAFERMAHDVVASQDALEAARRRTATVLANVATGVVALDRAMRVTIANAAAQVVLDATLPPGAAIDTVTAGEWDAVWGWVERSQRDTDAQEGQEEFTVRGRRIRVRVAPLQTDPRGCVVALDDVTEITNAVRVLAWGEVARQVAHEIKNPLTPIRLGVQHLQRARRQGSADFDSTLERTAQQILAEIERLDAIARAFARFGAPPTEEAPVESVDLVAIAHDAAALYALGGTTKVTVEADDAAVARARKDEFKEVLINLVENARDAAATEVTITIRHDERRQATVEVKDNGKGIHEADLPQVFEPHFSTTTSGTGLGLAICRRLVESWGGTIGVGSDPGVGTVVTLTVPGGPEPDA